VTARRISALHKISPCQALAGCRIEDDEALITKIDAGLRQPGIASSRLSVFSLPSIVRLRSMARGLENAVCVKHLASAATRRSANLPTVISASSRAD